MAATLHSYQPSLGRRGRLNPIIEEESEDSQSPLQQHPRFRSGPGSQLKIEAWLSPRSDHFPTPRGINFLSAPILPSSPSSEESSPTSSSNRWNNNRCSTLTDATEFEDLYDVSDDEYERQALRRSCSIKKAAAEALKQNIRLSIPSDADDDVVREELWSAVDELKKITSPVTLTPSANLPMSPAQLDFMGKQQALMVPSAPPSLDGSLTSEQLAALSAPPTPVMGDDENPTEEAWAGVQLQPGALATLHALSNDAEQQDQVNDAQFTPQMEQLSLRVITDLFPQPGRPFAATGTPVRQSLCELSKLEIPSPGGFFSGLSPQSRNTWHPVAFTPDAVAPPTSTTAEQFYRCPWNTMDASVPPVPKRPDSAEGFYREATISSSSPVEQVIEYVRDDLSDDMPTARPIIAQQTEEATVEVQPSSPEREDAPTEIVVDYDPTYAKKQQEEALSHLDRTELWLLAQRSYLSGVTGESEVGAALKTIEEDLDEEETKTDKKIVRFSNVIPTTVQAKRLPSKLIRQESAYYRAFQDYVVRTHRSDVFVHQLPRFEALQAQRASLRDCHLNQLLGKYQLSVVPQSAKKRLSANVARGDHTLTDDLDKLRKEKEVEAMKQMNMSTWHVAAMKFLNGGKLISAPVTKRLARLSHMPRKDGSLRDKARVLDLGGQSSCDWAWHCALQFPNAKIYTVTTKSIRQLSNSNVRGPPNHRQAAVERLTRLPFTDNHFDLVSARELHSILKFTGENGQDEWEGCLKEIMRILKPGGYLDFSILDSDIMNAGPLGLAKSVEFGFALKTLGYDPSPSKMWLGRLARAGFQDVRRGWVCLPMGAKKMPAVVSQEGDEVKQMEATLTGSTDAIGHVSSVVGGWSWERWLLRCEMEKVAGELRLVDTVTKGESIKEAAKCLEGVAAVMEEGRASKSAWRMLNGYAMKPRE